MNTENRLDTEFPYLKVIGMGGKQLTKAAQITNGTLGKVKDTSIYDAENELIANTDFEGDFSTLENMYSDINFQQSPDKYQLGALTGAQKGAKILTDTLSGAADGASLFSVNPIAGTIGTVANAATSALLSVWETNELEKNAAREAERLSNERNAAYNRMRLNYKNAVNRTDTENDNFLLSQYAADGGLLETNGATWKSGSDFVDNGGTHENNPFGGVQYGIASDGLPNFVEEGEVIIDLEDSHDAGHTYAEGGNPNTSKYVLSNRVIAGEEEMPLLKLLNKNPEKYIGITYADIYKDIFKKNGIEELINRQDTKDYISSLNTRIAKAQEATKLREQQEEFLAELKKASPEKKEAILQEFANPEEEITYAAKGGKIHIAKNKKGTFTAAATKHGMGVQEFASKVLANKEDYSPDSKKWKHADGGYLYLGGGYIPYDNSNGFAYYDIDKWKGYDPEYIKWLNNRDWTGKDIDTFNRLGDIYKQYTGKNLTPEAATRLGQDKKFGPFHQAYAKEYERSQIPTKLQSTSVENIISNLNELTAPELPEILEDSISTNTKGTTDVNSSTSLQNILNNTDWVLPTISGATVLGDLFGITNTPDYSNADRIGRAIIPPRLISYNPTGRYVKPQLVDTNYIANRLANQGSAAISAARDLSGGNSATARAQLAVNNYLNQQAVGEALAKGQIVNNEAIQKAVQLNNEVDRINAQSALEAARANQSTWENYAQRYANQKTQEARLRESIDKQVAANKSANWNNFLENLEGYFENQRNRNMANSQYSAYGYYIDRLGKIHYTDEYNEASKKKQREIEEEANKKVKQLKG